MRNGTGTNWAKEIDQQLEQASIILLLVSAYFLASDYCYEVEMKQALKRHELGQARVIPTIVRPVDWKDAPFTHLYALPTDAKAITTWRNQDEAFVDVVAGIRRAIEDLSFYSASPSRAALPSIWNIPYPRNSFFIGRDEILVRLHTQLQSGQTTALSQSPYAISGLGGIGKTQIATEYAYRYHQDYDAVLWARAENQDALISSYTTIAALLQLPERDAEEQAIIVEALKGWLQTHQKWLLILDNADDLDMLPPFLPPVPGGHILLTTRAWDMQRLATRLEVETLSDEQGTLFLLRRAGFLTLETELVQAPLEDRHFATLLTQELGGLPLALDQAGAYLEATGISLQEYYEIYQTHRQVLLHERRSRIRDHPDAVATTWSLSFQRVQEKNPAATDLLRLCAFLSPDAIAEEILTADATVLGPVLAPLASDAFRRNQAIEALRAYSLIRRDPREKTLSVHRLVQAVLQDQLEEREHHLWAKRAVHAINGAFPDPKYENWSQCERLLQQALTGTQLIKHYQIESQEAGRLLYASAWYLFERAHYAEAEPLFRQALSTQEQSLGPEHPDVAASLNKLALFYSDLGKYTEAKPLYQRALSILEQRLGPEHPDVAVSLLGLAWLHLAHDEDAEAEPLYQRALHIREQGLGCDHPDVANTLIGLATYYHTQKKYGKAEPLLQRALSILEQRLGPEHPQLAFSLERVADLYKEQGKYTEAEPLLQRALSILEQSRGPNHPDIIFPLTSLANLYKEQGKYTEAELLLQQAVHIQEQSQGSRKHLSLAYFLNQLPSRSSYQKKNVEREQFFQQAVRTWEQRLGSEHPDLITPLTNLADFYKKQGKYEEAEQLYQRALRIVEHDLEPEPLHMVTSLTKLADFYRDQEKYAEAEPLYRKALQIREHHQGPNHPDVAYSLYDLASLYEKQGKYEEAERFHQRALQIREQHLGREHPHVALSLSHLALTYRFQKKYAEAEPLYQRALQIRESHQGPNHPDVAALLCDLALFHVEQGKYAEAEALYKRSLHIREQVLGPEHPDVATSLSGLANLYQQQGKYEEAEPLYLRALHIREQSLGPEDSYVATSLFALAGFYSVQDKYAKAELLYQRVLHIQEQYLRPNHLWVALSLALLGYLYWIQDKYAELEQLSQQALSMQEQSLKSEPLFMAVSFGLLGMVSITQEKYEEAKQFFQRALSFQWSQLGPWHNSMHSIREWYSVALHMLEENE